MAPTGGAIPNGTYYLVQSDQLACGMVSQKETLSVTANGSNTYATQDVRSLDGETELRTNVTSTTVGTTITGAVTCGPGTVAPVEYSVYQAGGKDFIRLQTSAAVVIFERVK